MTETRILKIQSLLYHNSDSTIKKFLDCISGCEVPAGYSVLLHVGDCSAQPSLDEATRQEWAAQLALRGIEFKYSFFDANLGFGKGHNTLFRELPQPNRLIVVNPDAVLPFHFLTRLNHFADSHPDFGIVESRQIPLEHPKDFNRDTFETNWASGASILVNPAAFAAVNGFDETFFMYCEDVDLSWRIKAAGYKIYYCLDTFIFHTKRLTLAGVEASASESYYGAISSMLLRAKYGRIELNAPALEWLNGSHDVTHPKIVREYEEQLKTLKFATEAQKKAASFTPDGNFATHRWQYRNMENKDNKIKELIDAHQRQTLDGTDF